MKGLHVESGPYFTSSLEKRVNEFKEGFGILVIPDVTYNGRYLGNITITIFEKDVKRDKPEIVNLGPAILHMYDEEKKEYVV